MRQRGWQWGLWALGVAAVGCGGMVERGDDPNPAAMQPPIDVQPQDVQPQIEVQLSPWVAGISMTSYHYWLHDEDDALVAEGNLQLLSRERYQLYRIAAPLGKASLTVTGNSADPARIICEGKIGPFEVKPEGNLVLIPGFACSDPASDLPPITLTPDQPEEP